MQTIATILDNRPLLQHSRPGVKHAPSSPDLDVRVAEEQLWKEGKDNWQEEMGKLDIPSRLMPKKNRAGARAGTLVVCPVIALNQWKSEIEKFTENDTLTVGIYHGPKRSKEMPMEMMSKYDVLLTTYQVLEQDFRKMMSPNKVACPNCGGKFKVDKLRVHLKYFCGESAQRTEAQARQRRTADRNQPGGGDSGGRQGGGKGGKKKSLSSSQKKPLTSSKKKPPMTKVSPKKTVRVKGDDIYDSDSELSFPDEAISRGKKRPSRSGATRTKQKIAKCMKGAGGDNDSSGSSYGTDDADDPSDDSDSSEDTKLTELKKKAPAKRPGKGNESAAAERAREKQRQALEAAGKTKTKKAPLKKKGKGKGKNKDDSSSSSSGSDSEGACDPLDGIDMDELIKEAMAGARFSVLHSFCWWRVVLE